MECKIKKLPNFKKCYGVGDYKRVLPSIIMTCSYELAEDCGTHCLPVLCLIPGNWREIAELVIYPLPLVLRLR